MPSYTNHLLVNFGVSLILFFLYQTHPFLTNPQLILALIGYFLGTVILTPDLDHPKSKATQKCGALCKPYAILSKHRGLSHHWLIGVATRIAYVVLVAIVVIIILGIAIKAQDIDALWALASSYKLEILAGFLGLFASNFLHIMLDRLAS